MPVLCLVLIRVCVFIVFRRRMYLPVILLVILNITGCFHSKKSQNDSYNEKIFPIFEKCSTKFDELCPPEEIKFYLYHNTSRESYTILTPADPGLPVYYNKSKETKILLHGYLGNITSKETLVLRKVFLLKNNYNLIVVDWGKFADTPCYPAAAYGTWQAGKCLALLLENFIVDHDFERVHLIGFSLGAHAAGFTSNYLQKKLNKQLGRITGLDPALPFFASLDKTMKLDRDDADFVDVVHTNGGIFGKIEPSGHVDFYVNGGFNQPACSKAPNIPICNHFMAAIYYAESVAEISAGFWGIPCSNHFQYLIGWCKKYNDEDKVLMGEKCDHRSRGVYFVETRNVPPFALGRYYNFS